MTLRIAVIGNCHAQYLAAALTVLFPDAEVRAIGKPFDGPIEFHGTTATFLSSKEMVRWMKGDGSKSIFFKQTTPLVDTKLEDRLTKEKVNCSFIYFPYVHFKSLVLRASEPRFSDGLINVKIRADEISNRISFQKSGIDDDLVDNLVEDLRKIPCAYTHNHFTGGFFAKIFSFVDWKPMIEVFGEDRIKQALSEIALDTGIPHIHSGIPDPDVSRIFGLTWTEKVLEEAEALKSLAKESFFSRDWRPDPEVEYRNYTLWRMLFATAKKTGRRGDLLKCIKMYRSGRNYVPWCKNLAEWFFEKGYPGRGAVLLTNRMARDDSRGLLLRWAIQNINYFENSKVARRVIKNSAERYPNTNVKILSDIMEAIG